MSVRHFIQHIGGDPIALRYAKFDTIVEVPDGTGTAWTCEWTEEIGERAEWDTSTEARIERGRLGVGVVCHTAPDPVDPDTEAKLADRKPPPEPPPVEDDPTRWWDK